MWLLSTDRSELHHFSSPKDVAGGYAILSHTWGDHEQTFQEVQAIQQRCEADGSNPRDVVCDKIRECCIKAESEGYKWVWIDACCIDKTSSTELSEAISSMFGWYAHSEVCYAFLADVPSDTYLHAPESAFRLSKWHTRGWTLQELIAPSAVVFLSMEWQPLGTRSALASLLSEITLIPEQYLTHEEHHSKACVAERMTWAARRRTTRVEDEAYCLMGIFHVNIPTIYGEGPRAFERLQLEIMRTSIDTSLFAWGWIDRDQRFEPIPYDHLIRKDMTPFGVYLLARSPRDFSWRIDEGTAFTPASLRPRQPYLPKQWEKVTVEYAGKYSEEQKTKGPFGSVKLPRFKSTSYGVKCHLPIIEIPDGPTIAVLLCENALEHIGLLLYPSDELLRDENHQRYYTGYLHTRPLDDHSRHWFARLISLGADLYNLCYNGEPVRTEWRDIHIVDGPPAHQDRLYGPDVSFINCLPDTPFRIPHWLLSQLHAMNFGLEYSSVYRTDGARVFEVSVYNTNTADGFLLFLGERCTKQPGDPCQWAKVGPWGDEYSDLIARDPYHDCATDHVADWPEWSKEVGDAAKMVRMSFTRCRREPDTTLVLHLELLGAEWICVMADAHVSFPTREELGLSDPCLRSVSTSTTSMTPQTRTTSLVRIPQNSTSSSLIPKASPLRHALSASVNNARADANRTHASRPADLPFVGATSEEVLSTNTGAGTRTTRSSFAARRASIVRRLSARKIRDRHEQKKLSLLDIHRTRTTKSTGDALSTEALAASSVQNSFKDLRTGNSEAPPRQPLPSSSHEGSTAQGARSRKQKRRWRSRGLEKATG